MKRVFSLSMGLVILLTSVSAFAVTDTFLTTNDSELRDTSPTRNYGSNPLFFADGVNQDGDANGVYGEVVAIVKWDISSIPANATVTGASITFKYADASSGPYYFYSQNSPWTESTVTWNDMDQGPVILGSVAPFTFGVGTSVLNADGIALVQSWVDGSVNNNGILIRNSDNNNGISMEAHNQGGMAGSLEVTYTVDDQPTLESLQAEINRLNNILAGVKRINDDIFFDGVNVYIRNGLGATNGNPDDPINGAPGIAQVNGLGNLIVGYNLENDVIPSDRSGSHNIVLGDAHSYTNYGGMVTGFRNLVSAPNAMVIGGVNNIADGHHSFIGGGTSNKTMGGYSNISGGSGNTANGDMASISGGSGNQANGNTSFIGGGSQNTTNGFNSNVTGGRRNIADGNYSTVSGGADRTAAGEDDWVAGSLFEDF